MHRQPDNLKLFDVGAHNKITLNCDAWNDNRLKEVQSWGKHYPAHTLRFGRATLGALSQHHRSLYYVAALNPN